MPSTAACTSSSALIVSTRKKSTPPSARASACSAKPAAASSAVRVPSGTRISPVGPIEPATSTLIGRVGHLARQAAPRQVELADPVLIVVQRQTETVAAEGVGRDHCEPAST